jgi:thioredoxin-like negative regulator of GroEL
MKVQLLVSDACAPCDQAEKVWRRVVAERELDFSVVNLDRPEGRQLAERLQLQTIPALVVNGVLVAIGVQSAEEAQALVAQAPFRQYPQGTSD